MVKYLGMILHKVRVESSIRATIDDKSGKIRGASLKVRSLIEDFRMVALGGLMGAWILWEKVIILSLLSGSCNWVEKTIEYRLRRHVPAQR